MRVRRDLPCFLDEPRRGSWLLVVGVWGGLGLASLLLALVGGPEWPPSLVAWFGEVRSGVLRLPGGLLPVESLSLLTLLLLGPLVAGLGYRSIRSRLALRGGRWWDRRDRAALFNALSPGLQGHLGEGEEVLAAVDRSDVEARDASGADMVLLTGLPWVSLLLLHFLTARRGLDAWDLRLQILSLLLLFGAALRLGDRPWIRRLLLSGAVLGTALVSLHFQFGLGYGAAVPPWRDTAGGGLLGASLLLLLLSELRGTTEGALLLTNRGLREIESRSGVLTSVGKPWVPVELVRFPAPLRSGWILRGAEGEEVRLRPRVPSAEEFEAACREAGFPLVLGSPAGASGVVADLWSFWGTGFGLHLLAVCLLLIPLHREARQDLRHTAVWDLRPAACSTSQLSELRALREFAHRDPVLVLRETQEALGVGSLDSFESGLALLGELAGPEESVGYREGRALLRRTGLVLREERRREAAGWEPRDPVARHLFHLGLERWIQSSLLGASGWFHRLPDPGDPFYDLIAEAGRRSPAAPGPRLVQAYAIVCALRAESQVTGGQWDGLVAGAGGGYANLMRAWGWPLEIDELLAPLAGDPVWSDAVHWLVDQARLAEDYPREMLERSRDRGWSAEETLGSILRSRVSLECVSPEQGLRILGPVESSQDLLEVLEPSPCQRGRPAHEDRTPREVAFWEGAAARLEVLREGLLTEEPCDGKREAREMLLEELVQEAGGYLPGVCRTYHRSPLARAWDSLRWQEDSLGCSLVDSWVEGGRKLFQRLGLALDFSAGRSRRGRRIHRRGY